mgnify:CR=1 FL=1
MVIGTEASSIVGHKENFLENLSQKSANYVLCSEKIFKRVWDTSQQAKSVRKPQAKTDAGAIYSGSAFLTAYVGFTYIS